MGKVFRNQRKPASIMGLHEKTRLKQAGYTFYW
ncbi:hypothetical protein EDB95_4898 [Dinghuibacter silviterrae]|uniref:Uncharacterized protein n=1 Tax=Dinghuibacter silviterrae TaxID=1539049 RepID=A0A4R8DJ77_9BACT|nr:hypothetical protein EDB95_4898 [Dinghuibacter silviterrae]